MHYKKGTKLTHYKGGKYTIIMKAKHTETEEELIIYQSDETKKNWARPEEMFDEYVEHEGEEKKRFVENQIEKIELSFKTEVLSNCECCGIMDALRVYANGEKLDINEYIDESEEKMYQYIVDRYNEGARYFEVKSITTEDDEYYFIINGRTLKTTASPYLVEKFLKEINVEFDLEEIELAEHIKL